MPPAARLADPVIHPLPPVLTGGPTAITVIIGGLPAWRGLGGAAAAALQQLKATTDKAVQTAEAATLAAAGTPGLPAAKTAEELAKTTAAATMASAIAAAGATTDIHVCAVLLPPPPHVAGIVVTPSKTVMLSGMPAARQGDSIIEAAVPLNKIAMGCPTVLIGG